MIFAIMGALLVSYERNLSSYCRISLLQKPSADCMYYVTYLVWLGVIFYLGPWLVILSSESGFTIFTESQFSLGSKWMNKGGLRVVIGECLPFELTV